MTHHLLSKPPETDIGDNEYKYMIANLSSAQEERLVSQLKYRLNCGGTFGQAIYDLGLTDDGFPLGLSRSEMDQSLRSLEKLVLETDGTICAVDEHCVTHYADDVETLVNTLMVNRGKDLTIEQKWNYIKDAKKRGCPAIERYVAEIIIRKDMGDYWETRYGIAGGVDSGKSTLLGVLLKGVLDNGRGSARMLSTRHRHELESGRTSSVSQEIIGFNRDGELVNELLTKKSHTGGKHEWGKIVKESSKIITFFDLAGHLKYLSQTIKGLSSNELDYVLIIVGANLSEVASDGKGKKEKWINMTKEHMSLSLALGIPCVVVVTKIDSVNADIRKATVRNLKKLIKSKFAPYTVDSMEDVRTCVDLMADSESGKLPSIVPLVQVSNVTGEGHDRLRKLLNFLPPRRLYHEKFEEPPIMQIQDVFRQVEGTSTVIAGMLTSGEIHIGEAGRPASQLKIGPLSDGSFIDGRIRSIHCKKVDVASAVAGKYVCIGLPKSVDGSRIRKNMFAVGAALKPRASWEFWANIKLTGTKSGKVAVGYTPHTYMGHIRQTCKMLRIIRPPEEGSTEADWNSAEDVSSLSSGEEAWVLFRFCFRPELIFEADKKKLVFKESQTKGIGYIVKITDTVHTPLDNRSVTKDGKRRPSRRERRLQQAEKLKKALEAGIVIPNRVAGDASRAKITKGKMTI